MAKPEHIQILLDYYCSDDYLSDEDNIDHLNERIDKWHEWRPESSLERVSKYRSVPNIRRLSDAVNGYHNDSLLEES